MPDALGDETVAVWAEGQKVRGSAGAGVPNLEGEFASLDLIEIGSR